MSALQCPVCSSAFREVLREGILIDVCTQCRGVWLDRGELEKLLALSGRSEPEAYSAPPVQAAPPPQPQQYREQPSYRRDDDDDDDKRRYHSQNDQQKYGYKKKKRDFDFFDIFGD
jgi:uncharacterized protein